MSINSVIIQIFKQKISEFEEEKKNLQIELEDKQRLLNNENSNSEELNCELSDISSKQSDLDKKIALCEKEINYYENI